MRNPTKIMLLCAVASTAMAFTAAAQAQTSSPVGAPGAPAEATPANPEPTSFLDEVVVTAQKRSDNVQSVPAAVAVLGSERLDTLGVTNLNQIGNLAPGISVVPVRTQAFIFIRGVGQTLTAPNADAAVATNMNGVYLPAEIAGTAFFDIERIEVLPGPQGTLYGRNSTGGVVNLASRMPKDQFGADGFVEIGNDNRRQVVLGVDIPLTSTLTSRTAGTIVRHDGYFNNGLDDQETSAIRETLVWKPTDLTKVVGVATYTKDDDLGSAFQNIPPIDCGNRCALFDPKALGYFNRVDTFQASLQVDHQLSDALSFTYIGGYSDLDLQVNNTIWATLPLAPLKLDEEISIQSHEARLSADFGPFRGILGAYYFDQDTYYQNDVQPNPAQHRINPFNGNSHGGAVFGQGTYEVTPTVRLTGGLRYSTTTKSIDGVNNLYNASNVLVTTRPYNGRSTLDRTDWKVGVEADVAESSMLYASVSTGFTPGGFSTAPAVIGRPEASPFEPVTLQAYVVGVKNRLLDRTLTLNLEGFYYDYQDYQVSARDIISGENLVYNAEKATVYGAQVDLRYAPTAHDDFTLGATYLHAEADRLVTPAGRFDGFDLPYSPQWTVNAYYQRSFDLSDGAQIRADINFKYTSSRWSIYTHANGFDIASNTHTDLSLGYFPASERWYLQAFVRNLEDDLVKTSCGNVAPGPAGCFFEPPQSYGLKLGFKL